MPTYYIACFHVRPSRLFTAAAMLKTREANQKQLTASDMVLRDKLKENCMVVAVTAEKNVATVERFNRLVAPCFCEKRIVGTPTHAVRL